MTEQPAPDRGDDLEYDLAHEGASAPQPRRPSEQPVIVVTQTDDQGEDYSYDLAHHLPPQR